MIIIIIFQPDEHRRPAGFLPPREWSRPPLGFPPPRLPAVLLQDGGGGRGQAEGQGEAM